MKKLTDKEWYEKLKEIENMVNRKHEDYEVRLILADLYFTICVAWIWELPKFLWRERKIKQAIKLHKKCCDLD